MARGTLTTHVLDTGLGRPAAGLRLALHRLDGAERVKITETVTNGDGRTDAPVLGPDAFETGAYEIVFEAGAYLGERSDFLGDVPIRFVMARAMHYHVPLLLSPYGYSTYRGS